MPYFDTHTHLLDERFNDDREAVIAGLQQKGVILCLENCCDTDELSRGIELAGQYDMLYLAVGMHPHNAASTTRAHLETVARAMALPKLKAWGEIGLDYHYDFATPAEQKTWFAAQLELAISLKVPVVLHIREAFGDAMDILRAHKNGLQGEMHCFSGSYEIAKECVDLGLYIAFGGALTFKNAPKLAESAAKLPLDRLLIETDCPYMTPEPYRGTRNDPGNVTLVAKKLAALRGCAVEDIAAATLENGKRLFGIA